MRFTILLILGVLGAAVGCKSSSTTAQSGFGTVQPRDLRQADAYRGSLPEKLGVPSGQVVVKPGAGVTYVSILRVRSATEQQRIAGVVQRMNDENSKAGLIRLRFK